MDIHHPIGDPVQHVDLDNGKQTAKAADTQTNQNVKLSPKDLKKEAILESLFHDTCDEEFENLATAHLNRLGSQNSVTLIKSDSSSPRTETLLFSQTIGINKKPPSSSSNSESMQSSSEKFSHFSDEELIEAQMRSTHLNPIDISFLHSEIDSPLSMLGSDPETSELDVSFFHPDSGFNTPSTTSPASPPSLSPKSSPPSALANLQNSAEKARILQPQASPIKKPPTLTDRVKIGSGAVKAVYSDVFEKSVLVTAQPGRMKGLLQEVEIKKMINQEVRNHPSGNLSTDHLDIDLNEVDAKDQVDNQRTFRTSRADSDLEKYMKTSHSLKEKISVCLGIAEGMNELHTLGFVHGDCKPDNVLLYKNVDGSLNVKISDFDKAKKVAPDSFTSYKGNPRFVGPEGGLSQKGEVFSAAIMMIRVLEGNDAPMLVRPTNIDPDIDLENKEHVAELNKRKGVERFLVSNADCPQGRNSGFVRARLYNRAFADSAKINSTEREVGRYIGALQEKLITESVRDVNKIAQSKQICALLNRMTQGNPENRPTMSEVVAEYSRITS